MNLLTWKKKLFPLFSSIVETQKLLRQRLSLKLSCFELFYFILTNTSFLGEIHIKTINKLNVKNHL